MRIRFGSAGCLSTPGRPSQCTLGIRITVGTITGLPAGGESIDSVLGLYPSLEREDILAALADATWRAEQLARSRRG